MLKFSNTIPMSTQLLEKYETPDHDIRFTKVKIWLMHLGLNHNGSIFTKEAVQKAIPTLANTPIMASVGLNIWDEADFQGHESDIEITQNGELKFINKTIPFGVIPEHNNAKFETRLGDDMVEREYLTCEGLLWSKWDDAIDILYSKGGITGQSMELSDAYKGFYDGEFFEFTDFQFDGACLLGDDVAPAMENSTVEITYASNTKKYIEEKMKAFTAITFSSQEGGNDLAEDKLTNFEEEVKAEEVVEAETKEEVVEEQPKPKRTRKKAQPKEEVVEDTKEEEAKEEEAKPAEEQIIVDKQSVEDIAESRAEKQEEVLPEPKSLITVLGNEYSVQDLEAIIAQRDELLANYAQLTKEVHNEKAEAMINEFSASLDSEDISALQGKVSELSLDELQTQIFAIIGKKSFSTKSVVKNEEVKEEEVKFSQVKTTGEVKPVSKFDEILAALKK